MIQYKGNDSSGENEIIILAADDEFEGVDAEYDYLKTLFGEQNVNWRLVEQSVILEDDIVYDVLVIESKNKLEIFWFDSTYSVFDPGIHHIMSCSSVHCKEDFCC
jgi:hypothetical protein